MPEQEQANYPDLLGSVTGGPRLNIDVIQCALAIRPAAVPAGRFFELIFLLQNAADIDVDVTVEAVLPQRDTEGKGGRFNAKTSRLLVGLRPAEVGFVSLPVHTSPKTAPGEGYAVGLNVGIKRMEKKPRRIRQETGGGTFIVESLPPQPQGHLEALRMLKFSVDGGGKRRYIGTTFDMLPPAVSGLKELKADWISLWTLRDHIDDYVIAQRVWGTAQSLVQQLKRENVFMPLLKATQERFQACGYALLPPEAIFITKVLTLILEQGAAEPTPENPRPAWPRWFPQMCRLLLQQPALATQIEPLVARLLYSPLMFDAIMHAFSMVSTVTNEEFGTPEECTVYADDIVGALNTTQPLDFARVYLPLVLGGVIANARVTMPREQVRDTVFILSRAVERRRSEKTPDNTFIFELTDRLIDRAMDAL